MELEYQSFPFELKAIGEADAEFFQFEGFASTFGNVDKQDDVIERGTFVESLSKVTPTILFMHDPFQPIGMPDSIVETEQGLAIKGKLPRDDTFVAGKIVPQMKVGSIGTMSIGIRVIDFNMQDDIRHITKADLREISLVTTNFEANDRAQIMAFKTHSQKIDVDTLKAMTKRDLEQALRDSGTCSKAAATIIASGYQGEPGDEDKATDMYGGMIGTVDRLIANMRLSQSIRNLT